MKSYDEIIFSEVIKDYYNNFLNLKNKVLDVKKVTDNGVINSNSFELASTINNVINQDMIVVLENITKMCNWWKEYIDSMDSLNKGISSSNISVSTHNEYLRSAKDIFENEL